MPIRDIALVAIVGVLLPMCFVRPWVGVVVWSWLGFMNPHRLAWGFAHDLPFAQVVAVATLAGFVLMGGRRPFIWSRESLTLLAFWAWVTLTTRVALYPVEAWDGWIRFSKILLMAFLILPLFQDRRRLRVLLLVSACSIGFYGVKGGIWSLATGGANRVLGAPEDTFISTNNALALALNMMLPLFFYLAREERRRWPRLGLYLCFYLSIVSVLFTYSRGGLVGLAVVLAVLFGNRRNAPLMVAACLMVGVVAVWFAPEKWVARVETIGHYGEDSSANARLHAWTVAFRLANDRPVVGGGFWSVSQPDTWARYLPEGPNTGHDAHSIYMGVLAEHGYVGLVLYAMLLTFVVGTLRRIRRDVRGIAELEWIRNYAAMLFAAIMGFLVTGIFLSVAYFDLAYLLFMSVIVLKSLAAEALAAPARQHDEARRPSPWSPRPRTRSAPRPRWVPRLVPLVRR